VATPKYAERVAVLETKFDMLKGAVESGFESLAEKIDAASLNGETPRVKNMSKELGDPEDIAILAQVVESHKRWSWALGPFRIARTSVASAALWAVTGLVLGQAHAWLHVAYPKYIP
jgi:hypothetical protein